MQSTLEYSVVSSLTIGPMRTHSPRLLARGEVCDLISAEAKSRPDSALSRVSRDRRRPRPVPLAPSTGSCLRGCAITTRSHAKERASQQPTAFTDRALVTHLDLVLGDVLTPGVVDHVVVDANVDNLRRGWIHVALLAVEPWHDPLHGLAAIPLADPRAAPPVLWPQWYAAMLRGMSHECMRGVACVRTPSQGESRRRAASRRGGQRPSDSASRAGTHPAARHMWTLLRTLF